MKTTLKLLKKKFDNATCKFGGESLGDIKNMDILKALFPIFHSIGGRPSGVVVSAPKGLTGELHNMLKLSSDGLAPRSIGDFYFITLYFTEAWSGMRDELRKSLNPEQIEDYEVCVSRIDKEVDDAAFRFKTEFAEALTLDNQNKDQVFANVGSLGERMMGAIILKPLCELLTKFSDMNFVYIDPQKFLVAKPDSGGYSQLSPDVAQSIINLQQFIKEKKQEFPSSDITFVMPGFYLGVWKGTKLKLGIMEYNGSDTSAYILAKALLCEAIYIKKVVGELSDIETLRGVQQDNNADIIMSSSRKQDELIADQVLNSLLTEKRDLHIFDTMTKKLIALLCVATKKSFVITS